MARSFLTAINLNKNELQNAAMHNTPSAPPAPVKGQVYFNTTGGDNTLYWWDGGAWISAKGGLTFGASTAVLAFGQAKSDGVAGTAARSDHTHGTPTHLNADHNSINLNALAAPTADVSMGGFKITNVGAPTAATDAANKNYVDNLAAGLVWKAPVRIASTAQQALTGLTAIDGVTPIANDRVLLKNQTAPAENGIWLAQSAAWTRALDADSSAELVDAAVFVAEGTLNQDTAWVQTANAPITVGTTALPWVQFAGGGTIVPGTGLYASGNTFNVGANANGSIIVNADDISVGYAGSTGNFGSAGTAARSDHAHTGIYPPVARLISTTAPLTGGGDLSADRTLAITPFAGSAAGAVPVSVGGAVNFLRADGNWAAPALDTVAGDTRYGRKFTLATIGGAISQLVNHALNTRNVFVNVFRTGTPWDTVECDVERTDANNVTLRFAVAPAANEYTVVVMG